MSMFDIVVNDIFLKYFLNIIKKLNLFSFIINKYKSLKYTKKKLTVLSAMSR